MPRKQGKEEDVYPAVVMLDGSPKYIKNIMDTFRKMLIAGCIP